MPVEPDFVVQFSQQTVYLMGLCFIMGSLSTIFILLILDMVRRSGTIDAPPESRPESDA